MCARLSTVFGQDLANKLMASDDAAPGEHPPDWHNADPEKAQ